MNMWNATRTRLRLTLVLVASALVAVALTGCGPGSSSSPFASTSLASPLASRVSSGCVLGANTADVEVQVTGSSNCNSWVQALAGDGLTWQPIGSLVTPGNPGTADGGTMAITCVLDSGPEQLTVEDSGGQMYGNSICSGEEQNGWTPDTTAEASDQASADQVQASQSAAQESAASAAAQASQSAQVPQDDQLVNSHAATIESDLSQYNADLKTAKAALAKAQGEPSCQGSSPDQGTYDDASDAYSDGSSLYSDEISLTSETNISANDVAQLESDLRASGETTDGALARFDKDLSAVNTIAPAQHTESTEIENAAEAVETKTDAC
jgi:hypothetical protein